MTRSSMTFDRYRYRTYRKKDCFETGADQGSLHVAVPAQPYEMVSLVAMKMFLGSSSESLDHLREIAMWLEEANLEPVPWNLPTLFLPGENTSFKVNRNQQDGRRGSLHFR